jgi:hypothetical protein
MDAPDGEVWIGTYMLDQDGTPFPVRDVLEWACWFETAERHVALTEFAWGRVSTVFLGIDHSFVLNAMADPLHYRPVLWETMVFGGKLDSEMARYRSRAEALQGHAEMVARCQEAEENPDNRITMEGMREKPKS